MGWIGGHSSEGRPKKHLTSGTTASIITPTVAITKAPTAKTTLAFPSIAHSTFSYFPIDLGDLKNT